MGKVLFRVDGNSEIGMGHLIRCLSLALMLKDSFEIEFHCIYVPESVETSLINHGFKCIKIVDNDFFLKQLNFSHVVVLDHYKLGFDYQKKIKNLGCKLVCIDDLHQGEFFADLIINHSPGINESDYKAQTFTKFALGLDYALLRPAFLIQDKEIKKNDVINNVFICFGGSDTFNFTLKVLKILYEYKYFNRIIIVTGVSYLHDEELNEFTNDLKNIERFKNIDENKMIDLMNQSDLLIVPASGILLEAFATGAFLISGMCVDNQKYLFEGFKNQNLIISAGKFTIEEIKIALNNALNRKYIHKKGIDGKQKTRLKHKFLELTSSLRMASHVDCDLIYKWVNDDQVRSNSIDTSIIHYDNHLEWFNSKLMTNDSKIFVMNFFAIPVGQIRFEKKGNYWLIDYSIDKSYRGKGFGQVLIELGLLKFPSTTNFIAQVKDHNLPSIKVFEKLGFMQVDQIGSLITFQKTNSLI